MKPLVLMLTVALALAVVLSLSACGGGGSGTGTGPGTGTDPVTGTGPGTAGTSLGADTSLGTGTGSGTGAGSGTGTGSETGTDPETSTDSEADSDLNAGSNLNAGTDNGAEAIRAAIARGSTSSPPSSPTRIMITRGYNEPPAIDIESRVPVVDWRDAGSAPVTPTGTRLYDGYKLTRPSGEKEKRIVRDSAVYTTADGIEENAWVWTDIRQPSYTDFTNVYTLDHDTDGD